MEISSYRLGDLYYSLISLEDQQILASEHPETIGANYALSKSKGLGAITNIVLECIEKNKHLLPKDIENSTVIHLRLGDVVGGIEMHEKIKRPLDLDYYKNLNLQQNIYIIGKSFFAKTSSPNYKECIELSEIYKENIISGLHAKHFDGGHADVDLCCAIKCKRFVQGKGYFSNLIVEIRENLNLENIKIK
jgi:hypothetical protein